MTDQPPIEPTVAVVAPWPVKAEDVTVPGPVTKAERKASSLRDKHRRYALVPIILAMINRAFWLIAAKDVGGRDAYAAPNWITSLFFAGALYLAAVVIWPRVAEAWQRSGAAVAVLAPYAMLSAHALAHYNWSWSQYGGSSVDLIVLGYATTLLINDTTAPLRTKVIWGKRPPRAL